MTVTVSAPSVFNSFPHPSSYDRIELLDCARLTGTLIGCVASHTYR